MHLRRCVGGGLPRVGMILLRVVGVGIALRRDALHLKHVNDRKETDEKEEKENKETDGSDKEADVDPSRGEVTPGGGEEIAVDRRDDDDKPFEPHARVGKHHDGQDDPGVLAAILEPEKLGSSDVARDHGPVRPPVGTKGTVCEGVDFKRVAAVPGDKELHRVRVPDQGPGEQDDLAHVVDVLVGDEVVKVIDLAKGNEKGENHSETAKDGARHKVRWKDGGVPSGNDGSGKIERHDTVHGQNERGRNSRENEIRFLVMGPVTVGAPPTQGQQTVCHLTKPGGGAIPQGSKVGDQAQIPEDEGDGEIGECRQRDHRRQSPLQLLQGLL